LAEPPAESPSTRNSSGAFRAVARAIGELAGQAQLAGRGLAHQLLVLLAAQPLLDQLDDAVDQIIGARRIGRQPMVEMILDRRFDQARRLDVGELLLGLALELGLADEEGEHHAAPPQTSSGVIWAALRLPVSSP
jgi:hypothetical protein